MELPKTIQEKDIFAGATPGHSLTDDNARWPWGRPPQVVDPEEALEEAIVQLENPKRKSELLKLLVVGVSVETIVEGYILAAFQKGKFNPDVGILIKGPLGLYVAGVAEEEKVPYRFFENNDVFEKDTMDDRTFFSMMRENNPTMFEYIKENINDGIRRGEAPREEKSFIGGDK